MTERPSPATPPLPDYLVIGNAAAELLGYLETHADGGMLFAIGMLIAAHGADMLGERAGVVRVNMRARMIDDGAVNKVFGGAPRLKPTYTLRDAVNAGRIVERCCPKCMNVTQRDLSVEEIAFLDSHSMSEWPHIECGTCGYKGIGTRVEHRRGMAAHLPRVERPDLT